jgi:hypothetical protein
MGMRVKVHGTTTGLGGGGAREEDALERAQSEKDLKTGGLLCFGPSSKSVSKVTVSGRPRNPFPFK